MNLPRGICPSCGTEHFGWALTNPCHQRCGWCGAQLLIKETCRISSGVELSHNRMTDAKEINGKSHPTDTTPDTMHSQT